MKCRVCGNEMSNNLCESCGWEEENILDDEYLEIYNKKFEILKRNFEQLQNNAQLNEFLDKLIEKFNPLLKDKKFIELNEFLDLVLDLVKETSKYPDFLIAKIYVLLQLSKIDEVKHYFNELLKFEDVLDSHNLEYLNQLKKVLNV